MARPAAVLDILVNAQTGKASAELKRFEKNLKSTERQAQDTDKQIVSSDKNTKNFSSSIGDANQRVLGLKNALGVVKFPAFIAGAGAAAQAVSALGAGAVGLTSALAPLSGLLAAYPALLGAIGQAAGVKALAGFEDLTSAVGGLNEKLDETSDEFKQLSPQAQKFARSLEQAKAPLLDLQAVVQKPLFKGLNEGIDAAMDNFPSLQRVMKSTAGVMGDLAKQAGEFVGRKGFGKDFESIGKNNAQLLGRMGEAGLNFADALRHVMVAAEPLIDFLGKGIKSFSEWTEQEAKAGRESGRLAEFFERTQKVVTQLVSIGGSLASAFMDIGRAARPLGEDILKELVHQAELLAKWTSGNQDTLRKYFADARGPLAEAGKLMKDLVAGFFSLSQTKGLGTFISRIRKELLPALLDMTKTTTKEFGPVLIDFLVEATKLMSNFLGSSGTLTLFVRGLSQGAAALNKLFEAIPGLASAASAALTGFSIMKLLGLSALFKGAAAAQAGQAGLTLGQRLGNGIKLGLARTGVAALVIGLFEAFTTEGGVLDSIRGKGNSIGKGFVDGIEAGIGGQLEKAVNRKSIPLLQKHVDHVNALIKVYEDAGEEVPADLRKLANAGERELDRMNASVAEAKQGIHRLRVGFHDDLGSIMKDTDRNMDLIRNSMDVNSKRGKQAIERNFNAATTAIERAMDQGLIAQREGFIAIHDLAVKELAGYGIKGADAEKIIKAQKEGESTGLAKGGLVPGAGAGDKVPLHLGGRLTAMVEPGEYVSVANRKATSALMGVNQAIPRFAGGGMVDPAGPGTGVVNQAIAGVVGNWSQKYNASINYGYDPGGGHVSPGHNITGTATDTGPAGGWAGESLALFEQGLKVVAASLGASEVLYGTAGIGIPWPGHGRFDHAHIEWGMHPDITGIAGGVGITGPVKIDLPRFEGTTIIGSIAAAALNKVSGGAEKVLAERVKAQAATAGGASTPGGTGAAVDVGPGTLSRGEVNDLVKSVGLPNWFGWVALAESGLNPNATSYANAQGLWQILMPLHQGLVNQHGGNAYNPMTNALVAAELERQSGTTPWNPSKYDGFIPEGWGPHQGEPFKRGGIVKGFQEGGKILLVGDSITKMALDAGGFPGGWDHPGTVVGGETAQFFGESAVKNHWGDSDYAALAFMMGTNDAGTANLGPALNTVKGVIGKAGLSLMTVPSGSTNQEAKNRMILGFGANAIADIGGVPLSDGLHPTSPEGIATFRQRIKDAGNKAKKAMKGGGGGGSNGGGGGDEAATAESDLSSAGMSFGEWVQSILGDGSKGTQGLSDRVRKAIKQTTDNITLWDAVIGGQEIRDAMSTSEAGSEMGPLERANQIVMNENLLMVLKAMKAWLLEGLKTPRLKPTARTRLEELLEGIQGVRGSKTGRLLDVEAHLDELRNPDTSGSDDAANNAARIELLEGLLRDANLRTAVSQAQYKVFSEFAGGFAAGGYIPTGKWGIVGEQGPEVVGGPMAVSPMGGTTVIINGDIVNTPAGKQPVEVQGAKAIVQQGSRGYGRRPLGSARGY